MITDAFDNSEVLFGTKDFYGEQKHLCDKCMIIFSEQIFEYMLDTYEHQEVGDKMLQWDYTSVCF